MRQLCNSLDNRRTRGLLSKSSPRHGTRLEAQLQGELNLTLRDHSVGDDAGRARTIVNEVVRLSENSMVEGVKEFCAKLESSLLGESKEFPGG